MDTDRTRTWYLADLLVTITVDGYNQVVLHRNTVLVRATDDENAYARAVELGQQATYSDVNPDNRAIVSEFLGVVSLSAIQDELEDGAEVAFSEDLVESVEAARKRVPEKAQLGVFRSAQVSPVDYRSKEVVDMMKGIASD